MPKVRKDVCRKDQGVAEPGNTCLDTPGTCESCPKWVKPRPAILKTWPAFMPRRKVLQVFGHDWGTFYFTLGRGKPKEEIRELWYTHHGEIIGHFAVRTVVRNMGDNLPLLESITGETSEWQIKLMNYVAVCPPPFFPLEKRIYGRVYHEGFRGWRYFDMEAYRKTPGAKINI